MKKHILCIGDSNTHGYCADPFDCADGGSRFNENERWTCLLQKALGSDYLIIEEGLSGRTTVFPDYLHETMDVLPFIYALLMSHEPIDLLVIMLGTNDTKERLHVNAACIALGMQRLVEKAKSVDCWANATPNILIVAPPPIRPELSSPTMGEGCVQKSMELALEYAKIADLTGCHFLDAAGCEFNTLDHMHLTRLGHTQLAKKLAHIIPTLV